jgi:hypothetical protein
VAGKRLIFCRLVAAGSTNKKGDGISVALLRASSNASNGSASFEFPVIKGAGSNKQL